MKQKRLLLFFIIALLPGAFISCHDDDDDLIGLWERKGKFANSPRIAAASFTLKDKGYLLGGFANQESLKDVWVYDINLNRWDQIRNENDPESDINFPGYPRHRAVAAGCEYNGKGYFGLGMYSEYSGETLNNYNTDTYISLNTTVGRLWDWWEFDPTGNNGQGKWKRLPDFPGYPSTYAIAFCIENKIYVGTGETKDVGTLADIYAYNVDTDSWEPEHIGYPEKVVGASAFVISNKAYIVGGVDNGEYNDLIHEFDPSQPKANQWKTLRKIINDTDEDFDDDYTTIRRAYGNAFVIDGYGYLTCGSMNSLNRTTWKYNPVTDLWEEVRKFKGTARQEAISFSTGDKKGAIITTGGASSTTQYYDDTWNFDPYTWDDDDF